MTRTLSEVLDYITYMHGRGSSFAGRDFSADDVKNPLPCREGAVIFPTSWTAERRLKWRTRHKVEGQPEQPVLARDYARTSEFV